VDVASELDLATRLADIADAITLPAFERRAFAVEHKADHSEVTEIDRGCEAAIVAALAEARPHHGVVGEEHGVQGDAGSTARWIIDPIDGTSGYTRGIPVWATLIALVVDGEVEVAMVSAPALGRRWSAVRGGGAFVGDRSCRVSTIADLADAQVSVTLNEGWRELGLVDELTTIALTARRSRSLGDFWQHVLVAEGALDVAIDADYDLAAVRLVVEEAGGTFTDRAGVPTHDRGTAVSSNGLLHDEIVARLSVTPA
jgi:histidinol-phosphatase